MFSAHIKRAKEQKQTWKMFPVELSLSLVCWEKKVKTFRRGNEEGYFLHLTHNPILPGFWEHLFPQPKPYFTIDIKYLFCALVQAMKLMHQFSMTRAHTRTERPLSNVDILKKKHGWTMGWTISLMFPVDGHLDRKCFILLILGIPAKPVATYTNIALHWDTSCPGTWVDLHTFSWFPSWWACGKLQKKRRWTKLCRWEAGKRPKDVPDPMPPPISGPTHPLPEECPPSTHPSSGPTAPPSCQFLPNLPPPNTHFTPKKLSLRLSRPKVLGFIHFSKRKISSIYLRLNI